MHNAATIKWMMIVKTTGMKWLKQLFHINGHRINSTGWMMKWWWNGGVERKAKLLLRECWTFLTYIFPHQQWKQCLESTLAKLREICKYLASACNSKHHARGLHYLTFVYKNKAGKSTQWGESSQKMYQKELSIINLLGMRRSLFANWIHYIATKKPQPLCERLERNGIGEKGIAATG